ncbi:MAG: D-alanyl-D-alanine carboxypeptidase/D-alanyl-D-alanine-endopeptidase [Gammaproteobacteria bacterium]
MRLIAIVCSLLWALTLQAASVASIQQLINQYLPDAHVGVYVQRADTGEVLINLNGRQHFTPASTTKLFTAYAALKTLGPEFTFNTNVFLDRANIHEGVYTGPVYLKFAGDPSLSSDDIAQFVKSMKDAGINSIHGTIFLDISQIPAPYYARGWVQEDLDWYFAAPISAAIIDENMMSVLLSGNPTPNQRLSARVTSNPPLPVTSYVVSATQNESDHLCQFNSSIDQNNHVTLYGCWPVSENPIGLKMAIVNPVKRAAQLLEMNLNNQLIAFSGEIKEGKTPADMQVLTSHLSEPLPELLVQVLRHSNNLYTETLAKQVGLAQFGRATFQAGSYAVQRIAYDTLDLPDNSLELYDGSGLSNYNMITPQALAAVLKSFYADDVMRPILMDALSYSGQSGTLGARMATKDLVGRFIGKTGAMSHISNLAGYLFKTSGQSPLIVVVMINQTSVKKPELKAFEIALMRQLMKLKIE